MQWICPKAGKATQELGFSSAHIRTVLQGTRWRLPLAKCGRTGASKGFRHVGDCYSPVTLHSPITLRLGNLRIFSQASDARATTLASKTLANLIAYQRAFGCRAYNTRGIRENPETMIQLLTTSQISKMLQVPAATLRHWRFCGKGPAWVKIEGSVRYDAAELQRYIDGNRCLPSVRARLEELSGSL